MARSGAERDRLAGEAVVIATVVPALVARADQPRDDLQRGRDGDERPLALAVAASDADGLRWSSRERLEVSVRVQL